MNAWYEHFITNLQCQKYTNTTNSQLVGKQMNSLPPGAIWAILMI